MATTSDRSKERGQDRFFGKYRGLVKDNKDPDKLGRIQVTVPAVPGMDVTWAMPCAPYAGPDVGFYTIPPVGALVWVEFESGNLDFPIWSGCFWDKDEVPTEVGTNSDDPSQVKVLKTRVAKVWIDDTDKKGQMVIEFLDDSVDEPVTVKFTLDSTGLVILCKGSKGTATITMNPEDIISDSTTLQTKTSKDTTMKADANLKATATKDMTFEASQNATLKATSDTTIQGMNVTIKADQNVDATANMNITLKGTTAAKLQGASATVSGDATTTIQGGLVKIN